MEDDKMAQRAPEGSSSNHVSGAEAKRAIEAEMALNSEAAKRMGELGRKRELNEEARRVWAHIYSAALQGGMTKAIAEDAASHGVVVLWERWPDVRVPPFHEILDEVRREEEQSDG